MNKKTIFISIGGLALAIVAVIILNFLWNKHWIREIEPRVAPDESIRIITDGPEIFRRAFWRNPSATDTIVHAERREWDDEEDTVKRWQWFLEVEPSPELMSTLRDGSTFGLVSVTSPTDWTKQSPAPSWFPSADSASDYEILQSPSGGLTLLYHKKDKQLFATDEGLGFTAAVEVDQ